MAEKLDKALVLYMEPELLDLAGRAALAKGHGAACGKCLMFIKNSGECAILKPAPVSAEQGVCGLFVGGKPVVSPPHPPAMKIVPRETAGYYEGEGVPSHCGNCEYFLAPGAERSACAKVEGIVHEYGCCNAWNYAKDRELVKIRLEDVGL